MGDIIKQMMDGLGDIFKAMSGKDVEPKVIVIRDEIEQDLLKDLNYMLEDGDICKAEDYLHEQAVDHPTYDVYLAAMQFYDKLSDYSDEYLHAHNFSRDEITEGMLQLKKICKDAVDN